MATKTFVSKEKLALYHEKEVARVNQLLATAKSESEAYADGLASNYDAAGTAATEAGKVQSNLDKEVTRATQAEEANAASAKKANDDIAALAGKVGTVADDTTVVAMIDAVDAIADANAADIETMKGQIDALIEGTYDDTEVRGLIQGNTDAIGELSQTHADDKAELEGKINAKADQTALDAVSGVANAAVAKTVYDAKVAELVAEDARIAGLVSAEQTRAEGVEAGLEERLVEVETFFKTAEGETIDQAMDTLVEIQKYITDDGAAADEMVKDIAANAKAIADHVATDHDFAGADATLKAELQTEIAKKADDSALTELSGKVTTAEGEIDTLQTDLGKAQDAISALQTAVGDGGSVDEMIDSAIEAAMSAEETRVDGLLAGKVDKVDGKGLSTNDLTNELKANYDAAYTHSTDAHAPANAQENVIETVKVNGTAVTVTDKAVNIAVPTDNAELANGAGYLVASDISGKADKGTTLASYGIADAYTATQTDAAIAAAVGQFEEISEADINAMFA